MSHVKMGQKRTEPLIFHATRQEPMRSVSPKHKQELREYNKIREKIMGLAGFKSELSGIPDTGTIEGALEIHHITGRIGQRLINPFNLILLTHSEHFVCQDTMSWEHKQELLEYIRPIRLAQGFKLEDYPALI